MWRLGCLVVLGLIIGLPVVVGQFLHWWGTTLVCATEILLLVFVAPRLVGWGVKRFAVSLFMTKSKVLRGAKIEIHRVLHTDMPEEAAQAEEEAADEEEEESDGEDDPDDDPDDQTLRCVLIDFTLTPAAATGSMTHWEPWELLLVPYDARISVDQDPTDDDLSGEVVQLRLVDKNGTETDDVDKITGPAHLRAVFACPESLSGRVKLRYYFEGLGDITLPWGKSQ